MYRLPDLPYAYDALEPHIDSRTMEIHHKKHHAGYVDKLNAALAKAPQLEDKPLDELLSDLSSVPESIRTAVRNNGGGHSNHSLFWQMLSPEGGGSPSGDFAETLDETFGDFETLQKEFTESATSRFGSGWAWLVLDDDELKILSTPNQDSPLMDGKMPILGLDVWEHAYYLEYQNRRGDYVKAWWNLVSWGTVAARWESLRTAAVHA